MRDTWLELVFFAAAAVSMVAGHGLPELASRGFEVTERGPGVVRVVTWNVGGAVGGKTHALPESQLDHVADVLRALDPDVVALQELASDRQAWSLIRRLGEGWDAVTARGSLAILARTAPTLERAGPSRGERWMLARVEARGHRLAVLNVHASAFDADARNQTVGQATEALLALDGGDARVLLGDLNLDVDLDKKRDLFSNRAHLDVETYNYIGGMLTDAAHGRGSTAEPDRRLDYVFTSPESVVEAAGPWKGRRAGTMDHDPVVADVRP